MSVHIKIAIVGAGGAGLCALRHFTGPAITSSSKCSDGGEEKIQYEATCFEQTSKVGGTWAYTDQVGTDHYGNPIHSSMYKNLRTNLPKECMAYPDFPFSPSLPSFIKHEDVQDYLEDYADQFDILKYIQFERRVKLIHPVCDPGAKFGVRWEVTTQSVRDLEDSGQIGIYDAIILGNGNYAIPSVPKIRGEELFRGHLVHSHNYRTPDPYRDQTVVILGANSSGQDIALEVSRVATKVYISHNKSPLRSTLPGNMEQKPGIDGLDAPSRVTFTDGSSVDVDAVILCTGYHYDYSFLHPECGVKVDDYRVTPLYKHLLNTRHPSMAIMGICKRIIPFPFFDVQARFIRAVLEGKFELPSETAMNDDTQQDYESRLRAGHSHRHCHEMSDQLFPYMNQLADLAGFQRIPHFYEHVYSWAAHMRRTNLMHYKELNVSPNEKGDGFIQLGSPHAQD